MEVHIPLAYPAGGALPLLHIQDQKPTGTAGGSSVSGVQTRTLNTVLTNEIAGASLTANQITLPAGIYHITAEAPGYNLNQHRASLLNVTDTATAVLGTNQYTERGVTTANVCGRFSIAATKIFELSHHASRATADLGLGLAVSDGQTEIYSDVKIWQVA